MQIWYILIIKRIKRFEFQFEPATFKNCYDFLENLISTFGWVFSSPANRVAMPRHGLDARPE